jgi:hypothetical protein
MSRLKSAFVAGPVKLIMMDIAQRDGELVRDLERHCTALRETLMMCTEPLLPAEAR